MITSQKPYRGMQLNRAHPLAKGLVGCWVMNEASGGKAFGLSGNGNHGTIVGADWVADGLKFVTANSDYIDCQQVVNGYPFTMVITTSKNTDSSAGLISIADSSNSYYHALGNQAGNQPMLRTYDGSVIDIYGDNLIIGKTYQLVGVWGANNDRKFYINGNLAGQSSVIENGNVGYNATKIGNTADSTPWYYLDGNVYNAFIYNRVLSAEEIAWLYREPYAMFQQDMLPGLLYYEATGNPYWYFNMLKRRNG